MPLVKLFASVLKRENGRYYLVTPAEQLQIQVDDVPFLATLLDVVEEGSTRFLVFATNVGDKVICSDQHPLRTRSLNDARVPYIDVRDGLEARVSRSVYYQLGDLCEERNGQYGVCSDGVFFVLDDVEE